MEHEGAIGPLRLHTLVTLDATLVLVLGVALLPDELDAVDAAVTLVEEREIVHVAARNARAAGREGAGAIDEDRKVELFVGIRFILGRHDRHRRGGGGEHGGGENRDR